MKEVKREGIEPSILAAASVLPIFARRGFGYDRYLNYRFIVLREVPHRPKRTVRAPRNVESFRGQHGIGAPYEGKACVYGATQKVEVRGVEPLSGTLFNSTSNMLMGWSVAVDQSEGRLALWCSSFHPPPPGLYAAGLRFGARFVVGVERALHQPFCSLGCEFQFASWSVIDFLPGQSINPDMLLNGPMSRRNRNTPMKISRGTQDSERRVLDFSCAARGR